MQARPDGDVIASLAGPVGGRLEVYIDRGGEYPELTISVALTGGGPKWLKVRQHFPVRLTDLRAFCARVLSETAGGPGDLRVPFTRSIPRPWRRGENHHQADPAPAAG